VPRPRVAVKREEEQPIGVVEVDRTLLDAA
jgi:hypothetical protein